MSNFWLCVSFSGCLLAAGLSNLLCILDYVLHSPKSLGSKGFVTLVQVKNNLAVLERVKKKKSLFSIGCEMFISLHAIKGFKRSTFSKKYGKVLFSSIF